MPETNAQVATRDGVKLMDQAPRLIVYCRSWCGDCQNALRWLDDMGYDYDLRDIDEDEPSRNRCVELAGKVVTPTFEFGDTCIVNFDARVLAEVMGEPPAR